MDQKFILIAALCVMGSTARAVTTGADYFSMRLHGLAFHISDVQSDAPLYPLKIDDKGKWVPLPGWLMAYDLHVPHRWLPNLRFVLAMYGDCALQPAGYAGWYLLFPDLETAHVSFGGGLGLALGVRRNWARYVDPDHESEPFHPAGKVEWAWGLFGEMELRFHGADRRNQLVIAMVPGIPHILLFSVGIRFPVIRD